MKRASQNGLALISVLLIMALALLLVSGLLRSHRLAVQGSAQQIHQIQLRQWALAVESRAGDLLPSSQLTPLASINLGQDWARRPQPFPGGDVEVTLEIEDLAGRFNLAPLLRPGKADEIALARWRRLLELLQIPAFDLASLRGTEVTDPTQLRLIPGVDQALLERLLPWVALLPFDASLNINTAPAQLLATLEGQSLASAGNLVNLRPAQGYNDVAAFILRAGLEGQGVASHGLGVGSRWFRAHITVTLGSSRLRLISDLEQLPKSAHVRVLQRRFLTPTESEFR